MKTCTRCGLDKERDEFYTDKRRSDGLKSWCKLCHGGDTERCRQNRLERDLEVKRTYIEMRREDPDYSDAEKAYFAQWDKENPDLRHGRQLRRKARKRVSEDMDSLVAYGQILYDDPRSYCGGDERITLDHIIPIIQGGEEEWDNLTAACVSCNSSKRDRSLLHFLLR